MRYSLMAVLLLLAACGAEPVMPPPQPLDVSGPVYRLNVGSIRFARDYISPKRPPNVEHLADITPASAVKKWADERLVAAGGVNTLEVDVKDASIVRHDIPRQKTGIEAAFTTEQTEQYDGTLEVELKIYNPSRALPVAHINVKARQSQTLPDDAAPIDRERVCHQITVELMQAIKPDLDDTIRRYFSRYLL